MILDSNIFFSIPITYNSRITISPFNVTLYF